MPLKSNTYLLKVWIKGDTELVEEKIISEEELKIFSCPRGYRATYEDVKHEENTKDNLP
jgi:hypothetical protein|tara:strand:- start:3932 stop:4108 length:177 start_codon:yes stop_codon:yes gene_type:complete